MIYLLTDYSLFGPYVGQLHSVFAAYQLNDRVIDLCHDLPRFNAKASAYLLPAFCSRLVKGDIVVAVVDPGVGSNRNPVWIFADEINYIGPDNGLFASVVRHADEVSAHVLFPPENVSNSFHGRDVFAPVAAQLVRGNRPASRNIDTTQLQGMDWPDRLEEVVYIDAFGNAMTGVQSTHVSEKSRIRLDSLQIKYARTFSDVDLHELFWYRNSIGLVEIAKNCGSAAAQLGLSIGSPVNFYS